MWQKEAGVRECACLDSCCFTSLSILNMSLEVHEEKSFVKMVFFFAHLVFSAFAAGGGFRIRSNHLMIPLFFKRN